MILKLIETKKQNPNGTETHGVQIVNAATGEPLEGIIGCGVILENGVRFLQVKVAMFQHEHVGEGIVLANRLPEINGRG